MEDGKIYNVDEGVEQEEKDNDIEEEIENALPMPPWYEPYESEKERGPMVLKRIMANDRVAISVELPTIAATNARSIAPKLRNFLEEILARQITVCMVSEIWEKQTRSKKFQHEVEQALELSGLMYISCPRPSNKRGGGAAIIVDTTKFSCDKLQVLVPGKFECVWAIIRPKS